MQFAVFCLQEFKKKIYFREKFQNYKYLNYGKG